MNKDDYKRLLDLAHEYALCWSGCKKVKVGSLIVDINETFGTTLLCYGANKAIPDLCLTEECRRVQLYGEDSKNHRLPSDCRAIHSEVDAIIGAGTDLSQTTIVVTRYPCEACARAIVTAGIKTVIYGRKQEISEETKHIFDDYCVEVIHVEDWDAEDTER